MTRKISILLAVGLMLSAVPANAVILTYFSEANYNAAAGTQLFFINFDGLPVGLADGSFAGQVDFGSPEASDPTKVVFSSDAMTDAGSTIATNSVGPVDGIFASPVYAFGMELSSDQFAPTLELYDASSTLIGSVATTTTGFFGVISDQAVASFVLRNGVFPDATNDRFFVDNFRANAPVPEPATLFLLGTGLAGIGAAYRRRRRS